MRGCHSALSRSRPLGLLALHHAGELSFFGDLVGISESQAFAAYLAPLRKIEWVVYASPKAVLAYLSRYTHRVAFSNSRIDITHATTVAFRWKDYRVKNRERQKVMRRATSEFIRRFLIHVLPPFGRLLCNRLSGNGRFPSHPPLRIAGKWQP
jgi:hypothetical protein